MRTLFGIGTPRSLQDSLGLFYSVYLAIRTLCRRLLAWERSDCDLSSFVRHRAVRAATALWLREAGPLQRAAVCFFGNASEDAAELAQIARELGCDMRFVLTADVPVHSAWGKDEAYRLGYLGEQVREILSGTTAAPQFRLK